MEQNLSPSKALSPEKVCTFMYSCVCVFAHACLHACMRANALTSARLPFCLCLLLCACPSITSCCRASKPLSAGPMQILSHCALARTSMPPCLSAYVRAGARACLCGRACAGACALDNKSTFIWATVSKHLARATSMSPRHQSMHIEEACICCSYLHSMCT